MEGDHIKDLLKKGGMSYRKLSAATGIPLTTLNSKIQKQSAFTVDEAIIICKALGADPQKELYRFTRKE